MKFLILLFTNTVLIFAQGLTLEQALVLVERQNLEVKAAEYEVQSASLSIDMANAQAYGQLDLVQDISRSNDAGNVFGFKLASREASFGDFGFSDFSLSDPNILNVQPHDLNYPDSRNYFQSKLVYKLPLYTGNKITAYQNMAKEMKNISLLEKDEQLNTKIYETRKTYFDMALLENSHKNLTIILTNIQKLETMTKEMIIEGYAKKTDLLEIQSKKANIERIIAELTSNQELLFHYLSFLLNQDIKEISTPKHELVAPQVSTEDILHNSLDIKKARTALKIRENMLIAEKSRYLPTVGAMAQMQTADDSFLGDANDHKSYTVGVQLTWNIFNGGSDSAAIEKAQLQRLKMQTQTELARGAIALQVKDIQTKVKTMDSKIKSLKIELRLAREIYDNYEGRYKEQLSSMSDVIIKQSSWLEKVLQLLQAQNERNKQIFALERLALVQGDR